MNSLKMDINCQFDSMKNDFKDQFNSMSARLTDHMSHLNTWIVDRFLLPQNPSCWSELDRYLFRVTTTHQAKIIGILHCIFLLVTSFSLSARLTLTPWFNPATYVIIMYTIYIQNVP